MELKTLKQYWDDRAEEWKIDVPLILSPKEIEFQRSQLKPAGQALILGATRELCKMAVKVSESVTAVDFSMSVIDKLRQDKVEYICQEWTDFFKSSRQKFDNILTDGGLLCLSFPDAWEEIADLIKDHLKPGGIFSAKVYVSTDQPAKNHYTNPNLDRFVPSMNYLDDNFMVHPRHQAYQEYDMQYTFPPDEQVLKIFGSLALVDQMIPDYEEGKRFRSYAFKFLA